MRTFVLLLSVILVLSTAFIAPAGVAKDGEEPEEDDGDGSSGKGSENERNRTADGNETSGNGTRGNGPDGDNGSPRGQQARDRDDDERREEAIERYRRAQEDREEREEERSMRTDDGRPDRIPEHVRARLAGFQQTDGHIDGRYIAFDAAAHGLANYTVGPTLLWPAVVFPADSAPAVSVHGDGAGNELRVRGDDWEIRMVDAPTAPIHVKADDGATVRFALPEDATVTPTTSGLLLAFPGDDEGVKGRFNGASQDETTGEIVVDDEAHFFVSAKRVVMENVANKARPQIEESLARGHFGAELNVFNAGDDADGAVPETVVYNDMTVDFESGDADTETAGRYTITVDAEAHEGKTIAVNFESGLLDPENLAFSYFNVDENRTVEATIVQADSLQDVLDPTDDGTIAEYWVVTDVDGTQVLVSIPHFSIHKIEIQSLADFVVERPSLVLGTLGAVAIVALAAAGMFRPPREDE